MSVEIPDTKQAERTQATNGAGVRDSLLAAVDGRIDERFDGETTRSSMAILLAAFAALMAAVAAITVVFVAGDDGGPAPAQPAAGVAAAAPAAATPAADISAAAGKGIDFEAYRRPDPALPAPPAGAVKRFELDVYEHVTKVSKTLAPTRVWSFAVNGKTYRGTGVSGPLVVTQGDKVEMTLVNGGSKAMDVKLPHSVDFHSSEVAPNVAFKTIAPGERHTFKFTAKHPGVFMYHCATAPVLMHAGAGMMGMMVVKPRNLAPVDRELWVTQQEYYLGQPGKDADLAKMQAKQPDVIAFNGYADQLVAEARARAALDVHEGEFHSRWAGQWGGQAFGAAVQVLLPRVVHPHRVVERVSVSDPRHVKAVPLEDECGELVVDLFHGPLDEAGGRVVDRDGVADDRRGHCGARPHDEDGPQPHGGRLARRWITRIRRLARRLLVDRRGRPALHHERDHEQDDTHRARNGEQFRRHVDGLLKNV